MKKKILVLGSLEDTLLDKHLIGIQKLIKKVLAIDDVIVINATEGRLYQIIDNISQPPQPFREHMPYDNTNYVNWPYPAYDNSEDIGHKSPYASIRRKHRFKLFELVQPDFVIIIGGESEVSKVSCVEQDYFAVYNRHIPVVASPQFADANMSIHWKITRKSLEFFHVLREDAQRELFRVMKDISPDTEEFSDAIVGAIRVECSVNKAMA